jgi:hypothetical protein
MENEMKDSEKLKNYYNTVYNSKEYKQYLEADARAKASLSGTMNAYGALQSSVLFFTFSIFFSIFLALKFAIYYGPILIIIAIVFMVVESKKDKKNSKQSNLLYTERAEKEKLFKSLLASTEKPNLPDEKLTPECIDELIKVFDSGRADTFKEALIIYEQDCQHRELVGYQNSLRQAAYNAQMQAENAKKEAEAARREADYQRREADYWREEERYWNNR